MAYDKQVWIDDDGTLTVGTLVTADRMNHIEQGIEDASDTAGPRARKATRALPAPTAPPVRQATTPVRRATPALPARTARPDRPGIVWRGAW